MWKIYKFFDFLRDIPKEIEWFFQRGIRGYSDRDVWDVRNWFENTVIPMLEQLQKTKHGYPMDTTEEQWDIILKNMIDYFKESTERYCSEKNEYTEDYLASLYENNQKKCDGIEKEWIRRENEITKYKIEMKNKAFKLFSKHFYNLWD